MINLDELERLAKESLWTGDWNASCGTVDCAYSADSKFAGEFDEIAHPVPNGVSDYIAAAQPKAILELVAEVRRLREDAMRYQWMRDRARVIVEDPAEDLMRITLVDDGDIGNELLDFTIDAARKAHP